jgi:hypothetical protein
VKTGGAWDDYPDVDVSGGVHSHAGYLLEVGERQYCWRFATDRELEDPRVAGVGNVDVSDVVDRDTGGRQV